MNIMIVDDEVLVRMGLKSILESSGRNYGLIEACNGKEALELYDKHEPRLVFVDIAMPVMDGLEFISEAKKRGCKTKFVILTCHEELYLVRKAIKLGVNDYMVKTSIDNNEILTLADETASELADGSAENGNNGNNDLYKDYAKANILRNMIDNKHLDGDMLKEIIRKYNMTFLEKPFATIMFHFSKLRAKRENGDKIDMSPGLAVSAINLVNEMLRDYCDGYVLEWGNRNILVFLGLPDNETEQRAMVEEFCERLSKAFDMYFNIEISIGAYLEGSYSNVGQAVKNSGDVLRRQSFYENSPGFYFYEALPILNIQVTELEKHRDAIASALVCMDYKGALDALDRFIAMLVSQKPGNINDVYNLFVQLHYIFKQHISQHYENVNGMGFDDFHNCCRLEEYENIFELSNIFRNSLIRMESILSEDQKTYYDRIIYRAKTYISEHLDEDTDLETIAGFVNLSPNYFSEVFRQRTGERFIDYVVNLKINKAKEYIRAGEKVCNVMEKLGYANYSYFCRLFKRVTGKSLKEFRRSIMQ